MKVSRYTAYLIGIILVVSLVALTLMFDQILFSGKIQSSLGAEPFKLALQFLLITTLGGAVFALVNNRKEVEAALLDARKEAETKRGLRVTNLQAIDGKLQEAHRLVKSSKRWLRSRLDRSNPSRPTISKQDLEKGMDQLLAAQIAVEEVQDLIKIRRDLIEKPDMDRLDSALHYVARYLHDVFEEYEGGEIYRDNERFILDERPDSLRDFLLKDDTEEDAPKQKKEIRNGKTALKQFRAASSELKGLIDAELKKDRRGTPH